MSGFCIREFDEVTDDVLKEGIFALEKELKKRRAARKEKLILDFKKAFEALLWNDIDVLYDDDYITNFDKFEFHG